MKKVTIKEDRSCHTCKCKLVKGNQYITAVLLGKRGGKKRIWMCDSCYSDYCDNKKADEEFQFLCEAEDGHF